MKEVILHIGLHKTGSTSIQSAIESYNKGGVKVIGFSDQNHSIPMYTIFSEDRYVYHIWKNAGLNKDQINQKRKKFIKQLAEEVKGTKEKLLISGEDMSSLKPHEKQKLVDFFTERNVAVRLIVYVRRPEEWVKSNFQETAKNGVTLKGKLCTNFQESLNPFLELLDKKNILLFSFEDALESHGSIVKHFSDNLKLKIQEKIEDRENLSLNEFQLALILELNAMSLRVYGNPELYNTRREIVNHIKLYKYLEKSDKKYYPYLDHDRIKKDSKWLKDNFDLEFKPISKENNDNIFESYREIIMRNQKHIKKIFKNMGTVFCNSESIQNNFYNTYIILKTGIKNFDPNLYLELNPDVKSAGVNPYQHFLEFGFNERRRIK